jgi:hypothetical protein
VELQEKLKSESGLRVPGIFPRSQSENNIPTAKSPMQPTPPAVRASTLSRRSRTQSSIDENANLDTSDQNFAVTASPPKVTMSPPSHTQPLATHVSVVTVPLAQTTLKPHVTVQPTNSNTRHVKALFDFDGESSQELTRIFANPVRKGDVIQVLYEIDDGWWQGQIGATEGMFPSNYVEAFNNLPPPVSARTSVVLPAGISQPRLTQSQSFQASNTSLVQGNVFQQQLQNEIQQKGAIASHSTAPVCGLCGCKDFSPHAFKPGQCNACYHKH